MARRGENIYKRKDGRWEARYIRGRDEKGKAIYGYIYAKTYKEVRELKLNALNNSSLIDKKDMLFNELLDKWLTDHKTHIKESTYVIYYLDIKNHIKPYFENYYLSDINNQTIDKFINEKLNNGRLDGVKGLSIKTVKELVNIIKLSMKYAVQYDLIENININVSFPVNYQKQNIYSKEEYKTLVNYLKENTCPVNVGILLMMCTGLRIGELCALKNSDIDLDNNTIKINKTLQRITDIDSHCTKVIITHTKTNNSNRVIPIPYDIVQYINLNNKDNYFLTQSNKYMEPRTFRYAFKRKIKKLHLPEVTVHSLRHLFASQCIELGFDYNTLSEILGHSSPSTTMNLYVHSKIEYKRECMNRIRI